MRIKSPVTPSNGSESLEFKLGVEGVLNTNGVPVIIPEITLHISPTNLDFQYRKIITRTRTRGGWIEQHWGEELDVVSVTASTGTFQILGTGLTVAQRHESIARINFQEIFDIYKNNACVYDDGGNIISQGDAYIEYDTWKLSGQFMSFNYTEAAEQPYKWDFSFDFEVTKTVNTL